MNGNGFAIGDYADALVERADGTIALPGGINLDLSGLKNIESFGVGGYFLVECFDADGNLKWEDTAENGVTNAALNDILNVYLRGTTQTANFYIGLVDNASFTGFAAGDTMSSHSGWIESTAYSNTNRVQWSPSAASSQAVVNGTTCDFNMNATATIRGIFLSSDNTKSGTTGNLFATAAFSGGNQTVNSGDTLKVTYTVSAASS
jgi:hypothetical protein